MDIKGKIKKWISRDISEYYPLFFTSIVIFIILQYSFIHLDTILYDFFVQTDMTNQASHNIVIVNIDEESDQFLGEKYPYSFPSHEKALEKLIQSGASEINYLSEFNFHQDDVVFSSLIGQAREEKIIINFSQNMGQEVLYPHRVEGDFGRRFSHDQVVRRLTLNESGENSLVFKGAGLAEMSPKKIKGAFYDDLSDSTYALFKYNRGVYDEISFHRLVIGYYPKNFFKDKIVIIGPSYLSKRGNYLLTPFDKTGLNRMSANQILGNMIQALKNKRTVEVLSNTFSKILAIILSFILVFGISRLTPTRGLLLIFYLIISVFILSFLLFHLAGYWLSMSYIIISIFAVYYIWVPFRAIAEYRTRYAIEKETKILKKVDHLKQNFISLMSHDLKTPVAKIAGIADILKVQYKNNDHQNEMLENIMTSTKELNKYINSILDLTKIESQNFNIKKVSKDINIIIENIVDKLQYDAKKEGINLESELEPLYPIQVDLILMDRVISNLVENAMKYSGSGSTVTVKSWDDEKWVYVEVKDNGVGIKKEDLANVFEKFYRVKNDATHVIRGSGLGLYLVKYFVELHQGSINVSSEVGVGTSFILKLKNE